MIVLQNICKKYGDITVLDNFNLNISKNKISCIMGQSGKGKTTLIRLLMGLELPDSGTITGMTDVKISAVFQEDRLCENLNVYANLMLPHIYKTSFNSISKAQLNSALTAIGLHGCGNKVVSTLSGGMKRRTAILRALFADYDILFLDEPFKGLDEQTKQITMNYLLSETQNKTVIYITHDKLELDIIKPDNVITL